MQSEHFFSSKRKKCPLGIETDVWLSPAMQGLIHFLYKCKRKCPFQKKHSRLWPIVARYTKCQCCMSRLILPKLVLWQFMFWFVLWSYIKGLFSLELLYRVKNNLDPIVKLFLFSKKDTTFSQLCQTNLWSLITQPSHAEERYRSNHIRTCLFGRPNPVCTLFWIKPDNICSVPQFLSTNTWAAGKPLKDSTSSVKKEFCQAVKVQLRRRNFWRALTGLN